MDLTNGSRGSGVDLFVPEIIANWRPPLPAEERMRGLEPEDVYSSAQIERMRYLKFPALDLPRSSAVQNERTNVMSNRNAPRVNSPSKNNINGDLLYSADNHVDKNHQVNVNERVFREKGSKRPLIEEWISITDHLDEDDVELLLIEARHRARINIFLRDIEKMTSPPMLYALSPRSLKLDDFILKEWVGKGFDPSKIDRKMLGAYDEKLVRAIENYEYNNGILSAALRFQKVGNRRSKKEMTLQN